MPTQRLGAQDATFVYGEDRRIPLHIGALGVLEAAPLHDESGQLDIARLRAHFERRLHRVPLFRKRLAHAPFDQGRPVWVDDPRFRIENHVHHVALARPGSRKQLLDLVGRMQAQPLDRSQPLWEITFVEGLEDPGQVAMVTKIHHAMVDGMAGVELAKLIFDLAPDTPMVEPEPWEPEPLPGAAELITHAYVSQIADGVRSARAIWRGVRNPRAPLERLRDLGRAIGSISEPREVLPFNGPVSSRRVFETVDIAMSQVRHAKDSYGVTLNEIALAAISGALRSYCAERGLDPDALGVVRAIVPVNNRASGDTDPGNDVASMFVDLAVSSAEISDRVERIAEASRSAKALGVAQGTRLWSDLGEHLPPPALRMASWFQFRGLMAQGNLIVSNVPGPPVPLYCQGSRLLKFHPYFGIQDGVGLSVLLMSYDDQLMMGLSSDPDLLPEIGSLGEAIKKAFGELVATA